MKKIAVVLSGCGFLDGAEITEAVSTLIALSELGAIVQCFAPDGAFEVKAHLDVTDINSKSLQEKRSIMHESARITRGKLENLSRLKEEQFDAVIFPGGSGAAKNLSNWASAGAAATVHPEVARVIREFHRSAKPIGAICIAPTLVAKVLGRDGVSVTIGDDAATALEIEKTGAHHVQCKVTDYVSDRDHKVLSTPAYMFDAQPHEVFTGIRKLVRELVEMA